LEPVTEDRVRKIIAERDKSKRAIPQVLIEIRMKHYEERRREIFKLIRLVSSLTLVNLYSLGAICLDR
jgi:hypothetical protein